MALTYDLAQLPPAVLTPCGKPRSKSDIKSPSSVFAFCSASFELCMRTLELGFSVTPSRVEVATGDPSSESPPSIVFERFVAMVGDDTFATGSMTGFARSKQAQGATRRSG